MGVFWGLKHPSLGRLACGGWAGAGAGHSEAGETDAEPGALAVKL